MKFSSLIQQLGDGSSGPMLAVLIDPDKFNPELVLKANGLNISCFLVGGSRLESGNTSHTVKAIQELSSLPVVLFPGDETQLCPGADGLFLPSLLSGRNPDYLAGKQVIMAPIIRRMQLPSIPMAYLLIGGNRQSSTQKVTGTQPMDEGNSELVVHTAQAAELMGFKALYLEAGSGAASSVPAGLISAVKQAVDLPLIVGGGIDSAQKAEVAVKAGAKMVVVGNALEKNVYLLAEISTVFGSAHKL